MEGIPIPANWHADIAEWGAALRVVDLARDSFTVVELGCAWGCWLNNAGVAARRAGLRVHLIAVEGNLGHIGFASDERSLHHAGMVWDFEPIFGATEEQREAALRSGDYDALPMVSLAEVVAPHARTDLLHVDIQGREADLIEACVELLQEKLAYLRVGIHSRPIEGCLFGALRRAGWRLEIKRPASLIPHDLSGSAAVDGVQGWRNPSLLP